MSELYATSALASPGDFTGLAAWTNKAISLAELGDLGLVRLQGPGADPAFAQAAGEILGVALPTSPCTSSATETMHVLWLNPNEWLLVTAREQELEWLGKLETLASGFNVLATLNTDTRCGIQIKGALASELLAKGSTQDFHIQHYPVGQCTIARFNNLPVILVRQGASCFDLYVDRSLAGHTWRWLLDAADEFAEQE